MVSKLLLRAPLFPETNSNSLCFCRNCGKQLYDRAVACMLCGLARGDGNKFPPELRRGN